MHDTGQAVFGEFQGGPMWGLIGRGHGGSQLGPISNPHGPHVGFVAYTHVGSG